MNLQSIFWYRAIFFGINLWDMKLAICHRQRLKTFMKLLSIFWTPLISEASSRLFSKLHCEVIVCPFDKGIESFIYALQVQFHMQRIRHSLNFQDESDVYQLLNTAHFKLNVFVISRDQSKKH